MSKIACKFKMLWAPIIYHCNVLCVVNKLVCRIEEKVSMNSNYSCQVVCLVFGKEIVEVMSFQITIWSSIANQSVHLSDEAHSCILLVEVLNDNDPGWMSQEIF